MNPQHSAKSVMHGTPIEVVEAVWETFEKVPCLDPASDAQFNEYLQADQIFTEEEDGLFKPWEAHTVFCNPPGGTRVIFGDSKKKQSNARLWWEKAWQEFDSERAGSIIFLAFTLELFSRGQGKSNTPAPYMHTFCVPRRRLIFDVWKDGSRVPGKSPTHANAIILMTRDVEMTERFEESFSSLGQVRI